MSINQPIWKREEGSLQHPVEVGDSHTDDIMTNIPVSHDGESTYIYDIVVYMQSDIGEVNTKSK